MVDVPGVGVGHHDVGGQFLAGGKAHGAHGRRFGLVGCFTGRRDDLRGRGAQAHLDAASARRSASRSASRRIPPPRCQTPKVCST